MLKTMMTMMSVLNLLPKVVAVLETMAHQELWLKKLVDLWTKVKMMFKRITLLELLVNRRIPVPKLKWVALERNPKKLLVLQPQPAPLNPPRATLKNWLLPPPSLHPVARVRAAASAKRTWNS